MNELRLVLLELEAQISVGHLFLVGLIEELILRQCEVVAPIAHDAFTHELANIGVEQIVGVAIGHRILLHRVECAMLVHLN